MYFTSVLLPFDLSTITELFNPFWNIESIVIIYLTCSRNKGQMQQSGAIDDPLGARAADTERRFAYSLLEKLIQYLDVAALSMKHLKPSSSYSRRNSFKTSTRDVKFCSKVSL